MKRSFLNTVLSCCVAGLLSACATVEGDLSDKGFRLSEGQETVTLQNPPEGKSRIYAFRENSLVGYGIRYFVSGHYNFDPERPFANPNDAVFILRSRPGAFNYVDIERLETITLYAKTEVPVTLKFVPLPNQIYCLQTSVAFGALIGRPKFVAMPEEECRQAIEKIDGKEKLYSEQQQYKQEFYKNIEKKAKEKQ